MLAAMLYGGFVAVVLILAGSYFIRTREHAGDVLAGAGFLIMGCALLCAILVKAANPSLLLSIL